MKKYKTDKTISFETLVAHALLYHFCGDEYNWYILMIH